MKILNLLLYFSYQRSTFLFSCSYPHLIPALSIFLELEFPHNVVSLVLLLLCCGNSSIKITPKHLLISILKQVIAPPMFHPFSDF